MKIEQSDPPAVSLVLTNGKVITVNQSDDIAQAVAIAGNRIVAVGSNDRIRALCGPQTPAIDLGGRAVVPGLIDGHAHMDREGLKESLPSLAGVRSIDDILQRIEALVVAAEPGDWIVTMPIGEPPEFDGVPACLKEDRYPTRFDLDRVAPENPVYIRPIWGYWRPALPVVSIANSAALRLAGIDRTTVPPAPSVEIERDPASGEPTGVFYEQNRMPVVEFTLMHAAPSFDVARRTQALARSMQIYNGVGTTSVFEGHGVASDVVAAYQRLNRDRRQTVRAKLVFSPAWSKVGDAGVGEMIAAWGRWLANRGLGDAWLGMQGLYTEVDDSLESTLRASAYPQTGWAGFHYDAALPRDKVKALLVEAARNRIQVVGVFPYMLDLFREVDREAPIAGQRWVLGHVGTLTDDDVAVVRDMGLVATTHTSANIYKRGHEHLERLGAGREDEIVPLRSLVDAGVSVSLGSDNVPVSLFHAIWHCVARRSRHRDQAIAPGQALSRLEALRCATMGGAHLSFDEAAKGSIEPGKVADLAVLSADPLTCPENDIKHIVAERTIVDGHTVFDRDTAGAGTLDFDPAPARSDKQSIDA